MFVLDVKTRGGGTRSRRARAVVLATGYYDQPNLLGVPGEDLPHVSHYYSEPHPYYRRPVVVVGGKNSAAEAALDLYRAGARVTLVHREAALGESIKYWVKPDIENRIAEGSIPAMFETSVRRITPTSVHVAGPNGAGELPADGVFLLTGYHPDWTLLERAGVVDRSRGARSRDTTQRRWKPTCPTCSSPAASCRAGRLRRCSSRTAGPTGNASRACSGDACDNGPHPTGDGPRGRRRAGAGGGARSGHHRWARRFVGPVGAAGP